jgi:photosystem II stability/assembly factor-like uncharacterized protein
MSRRTFLRGFGLVGIVVAGASTASANNEPIVVPAPEQPKDFTHLAPENTGTTLTITGDNRTLEERGTNSDGIYSYSFNSVHVTNQVSISVGKDNRLWLKIDDDWKRVALDA